LKVSGCNPRAGLRNELGGDDGSKIEDIERGHEILLLSRDESE